MPKHSIFNTDERFVIDTTSRAIIQKSGKSKLMQFDHNSEQYEFRMPRYIDSHDMSECDKVRIHYINIGSSSDRSEDVYDISDLQIDPDDNGSIVFSWLISQNATRYAGSLNFLVQFMCIDDGEVCYLWHTDIHKGISISSGFNNVESVIENYSDVLIEWEKRLFGSVGDPGGSGGTVEVLTESEIQELLNSLI